MALASGLVGSALVGYTQDMFMKLFVTQLENQDPMEPMDNSDFTSQLAQMGQLEQMTTLNSNFEKYLRSQELNNASAMIGSRVRYAVGDGSETREGEVTGVKLVDGEIKLVVGDDVVPFSSITEILPAKTTGTQS